MTITCYNGSVTKHTYHNCMCDKLLKLLIILCTNNIIDEMTICKKMRSCMHIASSKRLKNILYLYTITI